MMTYPEYVPMSVGEAARVQSRMPAQITGPIEDEEACAVDAGTAYSNTIINDHFLSTGELAALLHVDASTLRRWRGATPPAGPPFSRLSPGVVVYSIVDVRRWIARSRIDPAECA